MKSMTCRLLLLLSIAGSALADDNAGFKPLFDGTTLTGWKPWKGDEGFWRVENGTIIAESTPEKPCRTNTFLVWDHGQVDDFELRLKFRISGSDQANSGIQFRGSQREDGHVIGYQADIDRKGQWVGALYDEAQRGVLATRGQKTLMTASGERKAEDVASAEELFKQIRINDWNDYSITARGNEITLKINGLVTAQLVDDDPNGVDLQGLLALQLHSGPPMKIEWKDIRLKRFPLSGSRKKVVFVAGSRSHGYMSHEHNAGCLLLAEKLNTAARRDGLPVLAAVYLNGWPSDPTAFDNADTVVSYCDGGTRHYLNDRLEEFDALVEQRGVGLVCIHYAVETTPGECGNHFLEWMGGYFEPHWSVNPHWVAKYETLPEHPITRGVKPFETNDEWYYHMRFVPEMKGVTPILTALPPRESLTRPDGPHSGNPYVREDVLEKKQPQHMAWAYERSRDKGRGFGFTGGHYHMNWQDDSFRKLVLNAIVWTAHGDVPANGVGSVTPTLEELEKNQDEPKPEPKKTSALPGEPPVRMDVQRLEFVSAPADQAASDVHEPARALEQLDVHPELEAKLFASEPMMTNPASIDIDHLGRVWVCEAINYRAFRNADVIGDLAKEGDRILVLEDTDGDAKADTSTVFHQGHDVDSAHGIMVMPSSGRAGSRLPESTGRAGSRLPESKTNTPEATTNRSEAGRREPALRVIISALDSVFFLIDDDGDLKADRKELLFTGIGGAQHDHGIHAFHFGPDGKLYFNFGNEGKQIKDKNGSPIIDKMGNEVNNSRQPYQEGMVFRCNLDGSEFETLAWNFRNNWEVCVDSFGTMWQSDNDDDGNFGVRINYVMEYGNYGYRDELAGAAWREPRTNWEATIPERHWHLNDPGVIPNLLQTGAGAPTGICVYEGNLLPQVFQGAILHCDAGPNICRAYVPKAAGAGYTAEIVNILDGSKNKWFRPSDVCIAPDGSILVADWYDAGVGGHRMVDAAHGRIFRVTPKGDIAGKYAAKIVDVSTPEGAVEALKSPNMATRYMGWTALKGMGEKAHSVLQTLWKSDNPFFRARALWILGNVGIDRIARYEAVKMGMADADFSVKVAAMRLNRQLFKQISSQNVGLNPMARESLINLHEMPHGQADVEQAVAFSWTMLARSYDGVDRWYLEALGIGAEGRWDACLAQWMNAVGNNWKSTKAGRDIVWRSRSSQTAKLLAELIVDPATPSIELPRYFRALDFQSAESRNAVLPGLAFDDFPNLGNEQLTLIRTEALSRLQGFDVSQNPKYKIALDNALEAGKGTTQFVRLVDKFNLQDRYPELLALAQAQPESQVAVEAMQALYGKKQWDLISKPLWGDDVELAEKTMLAMATTGDGRSNGPLLAVMANEQRPLSLRRLAVKGVGASLPGAQKLLELAQKNEYPPMLKEAFAATLNSVVWRSVRDPAASIFPPPPGKNSTPLPPLSQLVEMKGDVARGRIIFNTTGTCNKCHKVNGIGVEIGPDLSEIGKKLARQAAFESILYPSAAVSHNFETWLIVTDDGLTTTGLLVSETSAELKLKDEKGLIRTIPAPSIEEKKKSEVSLMPADIQKLITAQELVDIVDYLATLKEKK